MAEKQTAAGVRVEQGRTFLSNIPAQERARPISGVSFRPSRTEQAARAASQTAQTTRSAVRVARVIGGTTRRTLTKRQDPYERIRKYDMDIELARRRRRLEELNRQKGRFRIPRVGGRGRKKGNREVQRLRLEVGRLKAQIRRLRA